MNRYTLPAIYLLIGLLAGVSLAFYGPWTPPSSDTTSSTLETIDPVHEVAAAGEELAEPLAPPTRISPPPKLFPAKEKSPFPLPNTFDQLMVHSPLRYEPTLKMTDKGKEIIDQIRNLHKPTELIPNSRNSEFLCAGYIAELSIAMRGPEASQRVGLYNVPGGVCDAREIPYCYWYYGGSVLYDIGASHGATLKKSAHSFPQIVTPEEMIRFFAAAFRPANLLSDIGFVYHDSRYLDMLGGVYGNYNTHITKNMGLSDFTLTVEYPSDEVHIGNDLLLRNTLGCTEEMRPLIKPLLSRYALQINGNPARYMLDGSLMLVDEAKEKLTPYTLQTLDQITYKDITLAHFYDGEQVDSLLQFSCQGEFYPINVLEINQKFIEKY